MSQGNQTVERVKRSHRLIKGATALIALVCGLSTLALDGCARLPSTTDVVYSDRRVAVRLMREPGAARYTHPVTLSAKEWTALLRGFSLRPEQQVPLRWFAEETPPTAVFREDELEALAPQLAEALARAHPNERVAFEMYAPGYNRHASRDVTAGWVVVRDGLLALTVEHYHTQQPLSGADPYDYSHPTPPLPPKSYLLYFEPGRFYVEDPDSGQRAVRYREVLKAGLLP